MLNLLDHNGPYKLPTGWHEVTTRQYCELDAQQLLTVEARASYFAGRPVPASDYAADCLAFMSVPPPTEGGLAVYPQDLGQETYLQVESIRSLLATQPLHACWAQVYGTFVARLAASRSPQFSQLAAQLLTSRCLDLPITDTYPAVAHCMAELTRLSEKYAELALPDTTEAGRRAREAGSERLAMFSHLNVARYYAEKFATTIEVIYQKPWEEIALYLYQDRINAEVLDNLTQQRHD